jgi:non-ribosomal peptide synthetase component F
MTLVRRIVEKWVDRQPDRCAVRGASTSHELTFRELWHRSGQLAAVLRAQGAQRDEIIGLAMHRSADMIVALLGIVRADAAYLPLDALAPRDRLAMVLADAEVRVVVEAPEARRWPLPDHVHRVSVRAGVTPRPPSARDLPTVGASPENPMYVAYTSGSTGRPKGVVIPHRAVVGWWSHRTTARSRRATAWPTPPIRLSMRRRSRYGAR